MVRIGNVWDSTTDVLVGRAGLLLPIAALAFFLPSAVQGAMGAYAGTSVGVAALGSLIGLAVLVGLPAMLGFLGFSAHSRTLIHLASFTLLLLSILLGLSLLYRYAPCRRIPRWHWVTPGSLLATVLWIAASALFSWYVGTFATYDATYGPLGTVVGVMMWFYVTVYAVLLGAELNAELELQTVRDSTDGPPRPLGSRGAYVADHVAEE